MKSLKNNIGFILALIAILCSIEFSFLANNTVKDYEKMMANDYNIIIVANKELSENTIRAVVSTFKELESLGTQNIIQRLSADISAKNLSILQNTLPKFYSLKLTSFPNTGYINSLRSKLLKIDGVNKVETFSKTHDKVYKILNIVALISYVFMGLIAATSLILMLHQINLWLFEHKERIDIMRLFGAPFLLKSALLYKSAIIDAVIATGIVVGIFELLPNMPIINSIVSQVDIVLPKISLNEILVLCTTSITLSLFVVSIVMIKAK